MGSIAGFAVGLFGILWTVIAIAITADVSFPWIGIVLPGFGVIFTMLAWSSAVYNLINATNQQRFAEYDFVAGQDEPDPLQQKFGPSVSAAKSSPGKFCTACGKPLEAEFRFCPQCGKAAG